MATLIGMLLPLALLGVLLAVLCLARRADALRMEHHRD